MYVAPNKGAQPPTHLHSRILLIPVKAVTFGSVCSVVPLICSIIYMALDQNIRDLPLFCRVITKGRATGRCKHQWVIPSSLERLLKVDKKEREPLISQGLLEHPALPPKNSHHRGMHLSRLSVKETSLIKIFHVVFFPPLWSFHPLVQRVQANMLQLVPSGHNMGTIPSLLWAI